VVDPQPHRWVDVEVVQAFEQDEPYLAGLNLPVSSPPSRRRLRRLAGIVQGLSREWPVTGRRPMTADQRVAALETEIVGYLPNHALAW
jgi:hypothetical protein